jgi:hypothetical protein
VTESRDHFDLLAQFGMRLLRLQPRQLRVVEALTTDRLTALSTAIKVR